MDKKEKENVNKNYVSICISDGGSGKCQTSLFCVLTERGLSVNIRLYFKKEQVCGC